MPFRLCRWAPFFALQAFSSRDAANSVSECLNAPPIRHSLGNSRVRDDGHHVRKRHCPSVVEKSLHVFALFTPVHRQPSARELRGTPQRPRGRPSEETRVDFAIAVCVTAGLTRVLIDSPPDWGGQAGIDVVRPLEGDGMNELSTQELLKRIEHGDTGAIEALLPRVYAELRAAAAGLMAHERGSHTLRPTELVHEAYLKMAGGGLCEVADRRHFVAIASRAMRQILVDHARTRGALKRGGEAERVSMEIAEESQGSSGWRELDVLQLDGALTRLEVKDRLQAEIVQLRVFGGLTNDETAMAIGVSPRWAAELWRFAKAWLRREISDRGGLDLGHARTAGT